MRRPYHESEGRKMTETPLLTTELALTTHPMMQHYYKEEAGKKTHIVRVPPHLEGMTSPEAYVLEARIEGTSVTALCGYTWIPSKDPQKFPVCDICRDIYEASLTPSENNGELPKA